MFCNLAMANGAGRHILSFGRTLTCTAYAQINRKGLLQNGHERICMLLKAQAVLQEIHLVLTAFLPPNC